MDGRWKVVHDGRRLLVSVDTDTPLSAVETDALAHVLSSKLDRENVNEVVLVGPRPLDPLRFAEFYAVGKAIGVLANDAGKAFRIAH
jgi:hypothetical protein